MKRNLNDSERFQARTLLRDLLTNLQEYDQGFLALPPAWRAFAEEWAHIDNIEGVHVYEAALGGWQFEIELKTVPVGCPLVLGSPSTAPYRHRDEAVAAAKKMLACFAGPRTDRHAIPPTETELWFRLHDCDIALPQLLFEFARSEQILNPMGLDEARMWLEARLKGLDLAAKPGPSLTVRQSIDSSSSEDRCRLLATLCRAHSAGIFQFPAAQCLSPSGHTTHLTPQ